MPNCPIFVVIMFFRGINSLGDTRYLNRILEKNINEGLKVFKAIAIIGPKFCGKTTISERFAKSTLFFNSLNSDEIRTQLLLNADSILNGPYPTLIDEWQLVPETWDLVRHRVDRNKQRGLFILTASSTANFNKTIHSGAGRIISFIMRPMSLYELLVSSGNISLGKLFDGEKVSFCESNVTVRDYATQIVKGGWPDTYDLDEENVILYMKSYVDALCKEDANKISCKRYNEKRMKKVMQSLARNTGSVVSNIKILEDVKESISSRTSLISYLDVLKKLYITEDLYSWNPNLRTKTTIRSTPARFFVDPSIGASILNITSGRLLSDFATFGLFFAALAIRDLRIYAESIHGEVFRYKDKTGLEIDAIIQLADGRWGAIQIKMGSNLFDDAASKLLKFVNVIDQDKMGKPSFLAIITATNHAYTREDGVMIIPLGLLKD